MFNNISTLDAVALDYETTNLNPYDKHFEIVYAGFGLAKIAWTMHERLWQRSKLHYKTWFEAMRYVLLNENLCKVIQNAKYEDLCSRYEGTFGINKIVNTYCTMLNTHIIDERGGCTSLDFQNLVRFGIPPYSALTKNFLQAKDKDDKTNTIRKANQIEIHHYLGLDCITTYNNYLYLKDYLPKQNKTNSANSKFLQDGHELFANYSQRGFYVDQNELKSFKDLLLGEMEEVLYEIEHLPEVQKFNKLLEKEAVEKKKVDQEFKKFKRKLKKKKAKTVKPVKAPVLYKGRDTEIKQHINMLGHGNKPKKRNVIVKRKK